MNTTAQTQQGDSMAACAQPPPGQPEDPLAGGHPRLTKAYQDFEKQMEQCKFVTDRTSTTRRRSKITDGSGQQLWEPPTGPMARWHFDEGWKDHPHKAIGHEDAQLTTDSRLHFASDSAEGAFMQILRSNILAMWVAWEALIHQLIHLFQAPRGAFLDTLATAEKLSMAENGTVDVARLEKVFGAVRHAQGYMNAVKEGKVQAEAKAEEGAEVKSPVARGERAALGVYEGPDGIKAKVLIPHSKAPSKKRKYTPDLGNVTVERQALFGPHINTSIKAFTFDLPIALDGVLHRHRVKVAGIEGARLLLRFFYGLRNILSHGDPAETFERCLSAFVNDTGFAVGTFATEAIREQMVNQAETLLSDHKCTVCADEQGPALDIRNVASWMVQKICEFAEYRQRVRVSTLLLESFHSFLSALAPEYHDGIVRDMPPLESPIKELCNENKKRR